MNTDEKILKALENLQAGQIRLEKDVSTLTDGQAYLTTTVEALKAGQDDIREQLSTKADKADIQDLRAEVVSKIKDHANRIEDLETDAGIPHPHKH